jgi:beta-glucosidase-like glycosyl hydrolase
MELSRLKIPLFFAYDVLHGQRTVFPISLGWPPPLTSTR